VLLVHEVEDYAAEEERGSVEGAMKDTEKLKRVYAYN
jgi:hypothetical protein